MATTASESVDYLRGLLGKTIHISVLDGRSFIGSFRCTDSDCNVIISNAFEHSTPSVKAKVEAKHRTQHTGNPVRATMTSRFLGLIVVPKQHITKIEVEERRDELASATQSMSLGYRK